MARDVPILEAFVTKTSPLPLVLVLLVGCSDDGGGPNDGGPPPGEEAGTSWPDQGAPIGCEQKCLDEKPYYCVTSTSSGVDTCVACLEDKHCQNNPYAFGRTCDTTLHTCVCESDGECQTNKNGARCHKNLGRCYCEADADCAAPLRCVGTHLTTSICALPCKLDADCPDSPRPFCDVASGKCVACSTSDHCKISPEGALCRNNTCTCASDGDCAGDRPWGNTCRLATTPGGVSRCGCETDGDCGGNANGPKCKTIYNKCTCEGDGDCAKAPYTTCAEPYTAATYKHCQRPCAGDADCVGKGGACDTSTSKCVACLDDSHCQSSYWPVCDVARKKCVECKNDSHCAGSEPYCDAASGTCVACESNADCQGSQNGSVCDAGSCGCSADVDCKGAYPWGGTCIAGSCGCSTDADCAGNPNGPTCYAAHNKCTCSGDAQCTEAPYTTCAAPYSSASYTHCQKPCASDADCAGLTGLATCDTATGKCVACMKDGDCTSSLYQYCLGAIGQCVECRSDADCQSSYSPACLVATGDCVECKTDAHCATSLGGKVCDVAKSSCTCKTGADCSNNQFAQVCDTTGCEECVGDADCGVDSLGQTCDGSICVCATDADCASHTVGHRCDTSMQACSCQSDADCPAGKSCTGTYLSSIQICQ